MSTYLVAEIGQNHQGSVEVVKDLCEIAAHPSPHASPGRRGDGVNAVKLCKRDLEWEMTTQAEESRYEGRNSFGETYGEHREALELSPSQHEEIYTFAKSLGLDFVETVCAPGAIEGLLERFTPDAFKVASRDLVNYPLLEALADTELPVTLSTGMLRDYTDLREALDILDGSEVTILHCLSQYPSRPDLLNLPRIRTLKELWPEHRIGWSDHTVGLVASILAVGMGAEVIEKHVTLDRGMRGSDHLGALERDGIYRWVRDVREAEHMCVFVDDEARLGAIHATRTKLERSVSTSRTIPEGATVTRDMLVPLSPGSGLRWDEVDEIIGKKAVREIPERSSIEPQDVMEA